MNLFGIRSHSNNVRRKCGSNGGMGADLATLLQLHLDRNL